MSMYPSTVYTVNSKVTVCRWLFKSYSGFKTLWNRTEQMMLGGLFWWPSDDTLGLNFLELPMDWNVGYTLNISKRDAIYLVAILYYFSEECPPSLPQSRYFFRFAFVCFFIQFILQFPLHFSYLINNIYGPTIFPSNFGLL